MSELFETLVRFVEDGGWVLRPIFLVTTCMWMLIAERLLYFRYTQPALVRERAHAWQQREDKVSWHAQQIRRQLISEIRLSAQQRISLIQSFIAICPLLGLLGTVSGMIEIFDALGAQGSSNIRVMAHGVSRATIPTMAGMVAALSGLYFAARLSRLSQTHTRHFADALKISHA